MYIAGEENECSPNFKITSLKKTQPVVCICIVKSISKLQHWYIFFVHV